MEIKEYLLFFTTPFSPSRGFDTFDQSDNKSKIAWAAVGCFILLLTFTLFPTVYIGSREYPVMSFTYEVIFMGISKIVLISLILKCCCFLFFDIKSSFVIFFGLTALTLLPSIVLIWVAYFKQVHNPVVDVILMFYIYILVGYGLRRLTKLSTAQTILVIILTMLVRSLLDGSLGNLIRYLLQH